MIYDCISKIRNKHGVIVGYKLRELVNGTETIVKAEQLKDSMHRHQVEISNLKLTSDGRIIDKKINLLEQKKAIKDAYANTATNKNIVNAYATSGSNTNQVKYVAKKINSKRVGKLVARALMLGIAATSLSGTMVGCGSNTVVTEAQAIENTQNISVDDVIDKINSTKTIEVDVKNFTFNNRADIYIDNTMIGTMSGKFVAIFDTIKFETTDDQLIATGKQDSHIMLDEWAIIDRDNTIQYTMQEKFNLITHKYVICDRQGNEVAYLDQNISLVSNSAKIYDMDDNVIVEIVQLPLCHDFTIEIKDGCKLDNVTVTTISVNYMMQRIYDDTHSKKSSSSNKNR